jgi:Flp pilus assembly protein TadG
MLRRVWKNEDGSALVEGAVILPVLFALLFGVYEFSWFFYQQHLISTGLRDGARYLARSATLCDAASPLWAAQVANAKNLATTGSIAGGAPRVKGWSAAMVVPRCAEIGNAPGAGVTSAYRGGAVISVVSLSTRFAEPSLGFFRLLGLRPPDISVMHSERMIGPG